MNMNASLFDYAGGIQLLGGVEITIVLPVILAGICLIGIAGNFVVLVALIHDFKNGKASVINTLLINLSAVDLLIVSLCVPIRALMYSRQSWTLGSFVCKTADWFQHCFLVAKSFTLAAIGQARYNHVLNQPKFVHLNPKRIIAVLVSVWVLSLVLPIPHIVFTTLVPYNSKHLCVFEVPFYASNFMNVFSKIYPVAAYVIPIIFTITSYTRAILRTKPRIIKAPNAWQQNKRITLMFVSVSSAFTLMWLPEWIAWIWARHSDSNAFKPPAGFVIFAQVFLYVSSTVNPIVFLAISEDFREGLSSVWLTLTRKGSKAPVGIQKPGDREKPRENGAEVGASVINSLQNLKTVTPPGNQGAREDDSGKILPDVEHFWQERRNTTAGDEQDPIPWERESKK